jgi:iron(III) transport system permease protein
MRSITIWRIGILLFLPGLIGLPCAYPFFELATHRDAWSVWSEWDRLLELGANTIALVAGTVLIAVPIGTALAFLVYRTDYRWRRLGQWGILFALFVPLPLTTSAWQAAFGAGGGLPIGSWTSPGAASAPGPVTAVWKPWIQGIWAAIAVHGVAAIPWVAWLVGQGLRWVERELEEDALTVLGPWGVIRAVTLVRARGVIWAATLLIAVQTASEISVTDVVQVRTFAEEVYTQMVIGDEGALRRSLAACVPSIVVALAAVGILANQLSRSLPPLETLSQGVLLFRTKWLSRVYISLAVVIILILVAVPAMSLIWKLGASSAGVWSSQAAWNHLGHVVRSRGGMAAASYLCAVAAGIVAALLAIVISFLALGSRWFGIVVGAMLTIVVAMPGPVIGLGLKQAIAQIVSLSGSDFLARVLYYGPSYVPVWWIDVLRYLPYACALVWPVIRLCPIEIREMAKLDGLTPGRELRSIIFPLAKLPALQAAIAVTALALGELSAGKLVETAGSGTLVHEIFTQMHYGVSNDLAALALVLLALVAATTFWIRKASDGG